jgi:hypothetical protein
MQCSLPPHFNIKMAMSLGLLLWISDKLSENIQKYYSIPIRETVAGDFYSLVLHESQLCARNADIRTYICGNCFECKFKHSDYLAWRTISLHCVGITAELDSAVWAQVSSPLCVKYCAKLAVQVRVGITEWNSSVRPCSRVAVKPWSHVTV